MPDSSPESADVVLRAPLGNLFSIRQFIPSLTFTSRRRSSRGDDNLEQAELYLRVTDEQLDTIYMASQQANETYAEEIMQIKDEFDEITAVLNTVKKARGSHESALKKTLQKLGNDAATKDLLEAARQLSRKAKRTSNRVTSNDPSNITLQTAPSSDYPIVPNNSELTTQTNLRGINFSFQRRPTANDAKKIEVVVGLFDTELNPDDNIVAESESVRGLRSRRSDLSNYSYHSPDAYEAGEPRPSSGDTSSQLSSQPRTSTGMQLGDHAVLRQCSITIINMQSNDSSAVSGTTSHLGVGVTHRGLLDTPLLPSTVHGSPCPSCGVSRDAEAIQQNDISPQDAAVENTRSVPEQYIPAASSSQAQSSNPPLNMQPVSQADLDEGVTRQASPLTAAGTQNAKFHSLTVSGSAMVLSPTMNFHSPGATGATNTYFGPQPAHSPSPQASAQKQHLDGLGSRFKCMEFTDDSVVYSPTFNDESPDASGAYNQEIPVAGS